VSATPGWTARIEVAAHRPDRVERLARTLAPESAREVPRAKVRIERTAPDRLVIHLATRDTGALRAALNTFLGWVELAAATEAVASEKDTA
jgi:tRNA threonylcarbamoyladenosine modification (KEOPS) complex  Pcc1 subunit